MEGCWSFLFWIPIKTNEAQIAQLEVNIVDYAAARVSLVCACSGRKELALLNDCPFAYRLLCVHA
eukprot:3710138-Amphidinium_carterae.1